MNLYEACFYFLIALFGACIGSFLNVVIFRLPKGVFFSKARSCCPACDKQLAWSDLIPVAGYLSLRGHCRYCGGRISPRYPIVETACAVLAVLCFMRFGFSLRSALSFGASAVLLAVALIDFDTMEIPDLLVLSLIPFAVCSLWGWPDIFFTERVIGFFAVSAPMLLLSLAVSDAFGGGDIKLMAVCGFLLGWKNALLSFFIALLIGGGYAAYLLINGKAKRGSHIAFGPYLCVGIVVSLLFGAEIINFYFNLFI